MRDAMWMVFPMNILLGTEDSPQEALVVVIVLHVDARLFTSDMFRELDKR